MADHMSVAEAAERLGISEEEVGARIAAGRLRAAEGEGDEVRVDTMSVIEDMTRSLSETIAKIGETPPPPSSKAGGWVGDLVIKMVLLLWVLAYGVELLSLADDNAMVDPWLFFPGSALLLAGLGAWARAIGELGTTNGVGVTIYGRRQTEKGEVGTAWLVALMVPLVPLRSYVVHSAEETVANPIVRTTSYRLSAYDGLCWPQVVPIFVGVWAGIAALSAWFVLG